MQIGGDVSDFVLVIACNYYPCQVTPCKKIELLHSFPHTVHCCNASPVCSPIFISAINTVYKKRLKVKTGPISLE